MVPIIVVHEGVKVVRDDLFFGGTKARYFDKLFQEYDHVVYATPAMGGAQTALGVCARRWKKKVTLFVAQRTKPHPRITLSRKLGCSVIEVKPGYLSVVSKRAKDFAEKEGAYCLPFGAATANAIDSITEAAVSTGENPAEVWCAAGSGTLATGLMRAWPQARHRVVQVGRAFSLPGAEILPYAKPFEKTTVNPHFPSDGHYDAKAWETCLRNRSDGEGVMFWNVTGTAEAFFDNMNSF